MKRARWIAAFGLLTALAIAAGCGKKSDEQPVEPESTRQPDPDTVAANKAKAMKRLKTIGRAAYNYAVTANDTYPVGFVGPNGQFGLSWRVAILPFLGDDETDNFLMMQLYTEFHLKEPWDSEHNMKLIAKMPKAFASPGKDAGVGKTYLRSFVGPLAIIPTSPGEPKGILRNNPKFQVFGRFFGRSMDEIADGEANTLFLAEAAEPVEWTKPDELEFLDQAPAAANGGQLLPLPKLGGVFEDGFHGVTCDCFVHFFPRSLSEKSIRALITVNGGEPLDPDARTILSTKR